MCCCGERKSVAKLNTRTVTRATDSSGCLRLQSGCYCGWIKSVGRLFVLECTFHPHSGRIWLYLDILSCQNSFSCQAVPQNLGMDPTPCKKSIDSLLATENEGNPEPKGISIMSKSGNEMWSRPSQPAFLVTLSQHHSTAIVKSPEAMDRESNSVPRCKVLAVLGASNTYLYPPGIC